MNEIDYLRSQVRLERSHLREVCAALSTQLASMRPDVDLDVAARGAAPYLVYALRRLARQDALHSSRVRAYIDEASEALAGEHARVRAMLEELEGTLQELGSVLARFEAAYQARISGALDAAGWIATCREFDAWYGAKLATQRHALGSWLDANYSLADWRSTALVDADSVLEERRLYAAALAALAQT